MPARAAAQFGFGEKLGLRGRVSWRRGAGCPIILTALAAVLAFIPLKHSVFWGLMVYVLIGGTAVGTVLTIAFLPALYAIWYRAKHVPAT